MSELTAPVRRTPILLLLAMLVVVAAGCGGNSDTKANEAYADNVCGAIGSWQQQINDIANTFTGAPSQAGLKAAVTQAESATKSMTSKIKAVPPPDSSQGQAAKQQLDQLTTDINTTIDATKASLAEIQANPSTATFTVAVATLGPQIQALANETKSAAGTLKGAGGSLADAFKNTDSCKSLG